jgi:predicted PurR-regulated permease PerM
MPIPAPFSAWRSRWAQFTARHALIGAFTVLLLAFLFRKGEALALAFTGALRRGIGAAADRYVEVATPAVRAAVSSMLLVGLFDGIAAACAYAMAGAPRALVWGAITGALAVVPFVGYAAVAALAVQLAVQGATTAALLSLLFGCVVLLCGDKVVRPMVASGGMRLPFVCVLMGCVGGFGTLGLSGLVIGPVALGLARELWDQRARELDAVALPRVQSR